MATVHAKPEPQWAVPYVNPPICRVAHDDFELQNCAPQTQRICNTEDVESEVITYETKCQEVVSRHCPHGVLAAPAAPEAEAAVSVEKRDADPHTVYHGLPYAHHVAPATATVTLKHNCQDVTTKHCAEVPMAKTEVTPVETCHVVTKVTCTPVTQKLAKTECEEPEETVVPAHYGYPYWG